MTNRLSSIRVIWCVALGFLIAAGGYAQAPTAADLDGLQPQFSQLRDAKGEFTMTILPVMVPNTPMPTSTVEFARVLALALERSGLKSLEVSEKKFVPQSKNPEDLETLCLEFAQHVKQNPVETDYVYFTEYFGTPDTGCKAILTVVADRKGQIVWKKRQGPEDKDFQRFRPQEPMACGFTSVEPFRRTLKLADPLGKDIYRGEWTKFYANRMKQKMAEEVDVLIKRSVGEIDKLPVVAEGSTTGAKGVNPATPTASATQPVVAVAADDPASARNAAAKRSDTAKESASETNSGGGTAWIIAGVCVLAVAGVGIGLAKRKGSAR